ncbi:MAG: DUF4143 domain-containing protein, partial [Myxococcota bacterium]
SPERIVAAMGGRSPERTFFLFGPRSTGKTTWLREHLPDARWKNLLLDADYLPLLGDHRGFRAEIDALPDGSWVVIDEVQRIPGLLREVHDIISVRGQAIRFALSGSSARKLRRLDVDLLAGRAIERRLFPFTCRELGGAFDLERALRFGTLPSAWLDPDYAIDILEAYVGTYLSQEIQREALVEDIGGFHRFLRVAAILNGETLNVSGVARDAGVARTTVGRYFDTLVDTLVAFRLEAWQPRAKVRETHAAKFYFFDPGLVRALLDRLRDPLHDEERGKLLETYLLHELRASLNYDQSGGQLHYWRSGAGLEVDFVWRRADLALGIEVKGATRWRPEDGRGLRSLLREGALARAIGIYRGEQTLKVGDIDVLPVGVFLDRLREYGLPGLARG